MNKLLLYCILMILLATVAAASMEEATGFRKKMKVYYPSEVNVFEPFTVKVVFLDTEVAKQYKYVKLLGCDVPFDSSIGFTDYPYPFRADEVGRYWIDYSGEEEMDLPLTLIEDGRINNLGCTIMMEEYSNYTTPKYTLPKSHWDNVMVVQFEIKEALPWEAGVRGLPDGFVKKEMGESETKRLRTRYDKETDTEKIRLETDLEGRFNYDRVFAYEDFLDPDMMENETMDGFVSDDAFEPYQTEEVDVNGNEGWFTHGCYRMVYSKDVKGEPESYKTQCKFRGLVVRDLGPLFVGGTAEMLEPVESESDLGPKEDEWKEVFQDALGGAYFKSEGANEEIVIEEDDSTCGNCKEGSVCGACGDCIKESKALDPEDVQIDIDMKITQSDKSVLNDIESEAVFRVYPKVELTDHQNRKVDYCDLKSPGLDAEIEATLESEPYSGFTTGFVTDERETKTDCEIDLSESKPYCAFLVQPSDRKKFMGNATDMKQVYTFTVEVGDERAEEEKELVLEAPDFQLRLKSKGTQVQQGGSAALQVIPKGATTRDVIVKATLMGPGGIGLTSDDLYTSWKLKSIRSGETLRVGYKAPAMGNFDIGSALQSLSMVELQKKAAAKIAEDAFMEFGGAYVEKMGDLADAGEYSQKMGYLADAYSDASDLKTVRGVTEGMPGTFDTVKDAGGAAEGKTEATWTERAADIGVAGISAAQTAVSVATFIPNKIPAVKELSLGVQTAFSAATNIWKANLKYISKSEKIERAKELFYPAAVLVTAQDMSGWTVQEIHIYKIAYHQVD